MRQHNPKSYRSALRVTLIYAVVSVLWILLSDLVLLGIKEQRVYVTVSIVKGWFFVVATSLMLYALIHRDVARILSSEVRLSLLFDCVNDGVLLFHVNSDGMPGAIIDANDAMLERLGYTLEEVLTMAPWDLVKPERREAVRKAGERMRDQGQAIFETVHVAKSGREIPVEVSVRMIRTDHAAVGVSVIRDITERKRVEDVRHKAELAAERDKQRFYKETILAVTGGKLELGDTEDADKWLQGPEFLAQVAQPDNVSAVRRKVVEFFKSRGLPDQSAQDFELALGEALANAVKHAGGGVLKAGVEGPFAWAAVIDHGSGIDPFSLPKVALVPGYTTMASLGLGYKLIFEVSDHVKLSTGPGGTILVMEKRLVPVTEAERRMARHAGIE